MHSLPSKQKNKKGPQEKDHKKGSPKYFEEMAYIGLVTACSRQKSLSRFVFPSCFTMAAALITQIFKIFRTASTLTKFGSIIDHFILMQTDMSIIFLSAFLAEIHAFYVYRGAGSQIWLTTTRSTESARISAKK